MAPKGRPRKGESRIDAAINAMSQYGFPKEDVPAVVKNLLKEYGGTVGYPFIEADGYHVLFNAMFSAAEERKKNEMSHAEGQTSMMEDDSGQKNQSRMETPLRIDVNEENDGGGLGNAPEVTRRTSARISSQADKSANGKGKEKVEGCGQKKAKVNLGKRKINQSAVNPSDSNNKKSKKVAEKNVMDIDLRQGTGLESAIVKSPRLATVQGPLDSIERGIGDYPGNGNAVGEIGAGEGTSVDFGGLNTEFARRDNTLVLRVSADLINLNTGLSPNASVDLENHDIEHDFVSSPVNNDLGNFNVVAATPQGDEATDENAFFPANNQIVLVGAESAVEGPTSLHHKRTGIAGAISPAGTIIVDVDSIPLTNDDAGETWRGFHIGAAKASLIRQLEKDIPDFFDNVQFASGKRAVHDLKLLASNLIHFKYGQMHHLSIAKLTLMKDEFKDLERDGFRVDWAYKRIDQTITLRRCAPVEREIDRLNGESARLQGELDSLRAKAGELKAEIENYKSKVKLAEEELAIVEKNAFDKETEIGAVDSELDAQTGLLASLRSP